MSSVDRMLVRGIRSFSPENADAIEFFKPLTLILGHNGAGKTTIIESLKMALTGDLPPHSRSGQTFVQDPKVAGQSEVNAQIKLRFKSYPGQEIVVVRNFKLMQKKNNALQFKALEATLQTRDAHGRKVSQSKRCADIDREVPILLGVSKAVLENVIFCHQEDSLWPLSDTQTLKKKFDDIFSATKYTKALESIRKFRKEQAGDIKDVRGDLKALQVHKDQAVKLEVQLKQSEDWIENVEEEKQRLDDDIARVEAELAEQTELSQRINELIDQLRETGTMIDMLRTNEQDAHEALSDVWEESDEDLVRIKGELETELGGVQERLAAAEAEIERCKASAAARQAEATSQGEAAARLQGLQDLHTERNAKKDAQIVEIATALHMRGYEGGGPFTVAQADAFVQALRERADAAKADVDAHRTKRMRMHDELTKQIEAEQSRVVGARESIKAAKAEIRRWNGEKRTLATKLRALHVDDARVDALEAELAAAEADSAAQPTSATLERIHTQLGDAESKTRANDARMRELSAQLNKGGEVSAAVVRLDMQRAEIDKLERSEQELCDALCAGLACGTIDKARAVTMVETVLGERRAELRSAEQDVAKHHAELSTLQGRCQMLEEQVKQKEHTLRASQREIQRGIGEGDFGELLHECEAKQLKLKTDLSNVRATETVYKHFLHFVGEKVKCPTCNRAFATDAEMDEAIDFVKSRSAKVPEVKAKREQQLVTVDAELARLSALRPVWDKVRRIRDEELPDLRAQVMSAHTESEALQRTHEHAVRERDEARAAVDECTALQQTAAKLHDVQTSVAAVRERADETQRALHKLQEDGGDVEELQREFHACEEQADVLSAEVTELRAEYQQQQRRGEEQQAAMRKLRQRVTDARAQLRERRALQEKQEHAEQQLVLLGARVSDAEREREPAQAALKEAKAKRKKSMATLDAEEVELASTLSHVQRQLNGMQPLVRELNEYVAAGKERDLATVRATLDATNAALERVKQELGEKQDELEELRKVVGERADIMRSVDDNIKYRRVCAEVKEAEAAQNQIKSEIEGIKGWKRCKDRVKEKQDKLAELRETRAALHGRLMMEQKHANERRNELAQDVYRDIKAKHAKILIQQRTLEMANKDLDEYHHALDSALMSYHAMKMEEINKIIRDLWQSTYTGDDIDTIAIRSDTKSGASSARTGRSYNYRVVMVRGGSEMEMRGRGSAGQRVLASLVIRLALAETFCVNCGILALDEPTSNLDMANMESFARALSNIINARAARHANFQLLVITHDENFLALLGKRQNTDFYWHVSKDEARNSRIAKREIQSLEV